MADAPVQLIVAAFQDEKGADNALAQLKEAKKDKLVNIKDAAVLRKDEKGELHVSEIGDMTGARGGVIGGVVGAGLAIVTGGATLALAGLGAGAGALAAKLRDSGFKDERLQKIGAGLKPGSSAIIAVIEHTWVTELEQELQKAGAEIVVEAIAADVAAQLDAGNEVAYTAIADSQSAVAARVVVEPATQPAIEGTAQPAPETPTQPEGGAKPSA
jgi:uncharacterized membrane protein